MREGFGFNYSCACEEGVEFDIIRTTIWNHHKFNLHSKLIWLSDSFLLPYFPCFFSKYHWCIRSLFSFQEDNQIDSENNPDEVPYDPNQPSVTPGDDDRGTVMSEDNESVVSEQSSIGASSSAGGTLIG